MRTHVKLKHVDSLVAPKVFVYSLHKDFERLLVEHESLYLPYKIWLSYIELLKFSWLDDLSLLKEVSIGKQNGDIYLMH